MLYEWKAKQVLTRFGSLQLELDVSQSKPGKDRWFSYNQFEWIQDLHSMLGDYVIGLHYIGNLLCFLAAFGKELNMPILEIEHEPLLYPLSQSVLGQGNHLYQS